MTTRRIPLGRKEGQRLEFKGRDSLKDRYAIGREVVGMLNAEQGGEIWVGLAEEEHRAVLVEPIPDAEIEARSLHDFLMDSLEPAPLSQEIGIQLEEGADGKVLRIQVKGKPDRRPYALLRKSTRYYGVRVKDRLRPMSREEVLKPSKEGREDDPDKAIKGVLVERKSVLQAGGDLLWLRIEPTRPVTLELQAPFFDDLVRDPSLTGNRRTGWHFARSDHRPSLGNGRLSWELRQSSVQHFSVETRSQGGFEFRLPLSALASAAKVPPDARRTIAPVKLFEYLASAFRIVSGVYRDPEATRSELPPEVIVELVLMGLEGTALIRDRLFPDNNPRYTEGGDFIGGPFPFSTTEVLKAPDRCGFRLVRKIYEAFGLREASILKEFDRKTGRLVLPE